MSDPFDDVAGAHEEVTGPGGEWLVCTPLVGIELAEPVIQLDHETILWRADLDDDGRGDRGAERNDGPSVSEVRRILGDHISCPSRLLRFSGGASIDTGRAAAILSVERGTAELALAQARAKAQYAISVWVILAPPGRWRAVPDLGTWVPQPYVHVGQRYKPRERDVWPPRERTHGGRVDTYVAYEAPGPDVLRAPFEAFASRERRCARALLGASFALQRAAPGRRRQLSEQLREVRWAVEVLCESHRGARDAHQRWEHLVKRFGIERELAADGEVAGDAEEIARRLLQAPDLAAYGADGSLIDLGWPTQEDGQPPGPPIAQPEDPGLTAHRADLTILLHAVRTALGRLWPIVRESGFDDAVFDRQFV